MNTRLALGAVLAGLLMAGPALSQIPSPPTEPEARVVWAKQQGDLLLAANGKRRGVITTATGLQYEVIRQGSRAGVFPGPTDKVQVHYEGAFITGEVFDSSYQRGRPAAFPVNGVIKGWQEVLQLMRPGDIFKVWVPPDLGYGRAGKGPIGGQETLIFQVELLAVNPK